MDIYEESVELHKKLGGKRIILKGRGHFVFNDMKTEKFPFESDLIV